MKLKSIKEHTSFNRKGVVGLDVAKQVMTVLLVLAVFGFVVIVVLSNLNSSSVLTPNSLGANQTTAIFNNVSAGVAGFFGNTGTWLTLLAVTVIVAIASIILYYVGAFGGRQGGM